MKGTILNIRCHQPFTSLAVLAVGLVMLTSESAAQPSNSTPFRIAIERAAGPEGPWSDLPAGGLPLSSDGRALVDYSLSSNAFYRLKTEQPATGTDSNSIVTRLADLPAPIVAAATEFLMSHAGSTNEDSWGDAVLAPFAYPMFNPAMGPDPAYYEFKVVSPDPVPQTATNEIPLNRTSDRGYIVVGNNDFDFVICSHSMEGLTITETLRRAAGTSLIKVQRYDCVYHVAEDLSGNPLTWTGYSPVKYPNTITQYVDSVFTESDTVSNTPPPITGTPYASYAAFKADYLTSPHFVGARLRLKKESAPDRAVFKNPDPPVFFVPLGGSVDILVDRQVSGYEFLVDEEEVTPVDPSTICSIRLLSNGMQIIGNGSGSIGLLVDSDLEQEQLILVQVGASIESLCSYTSWTAYYAGSWSDQRRYEQYNYGGCAVGCGPVAWSMLYGWFDYKAYNGNLIAGGKAPLENDGNVENCIEYCNGACNTYCIHGSGATNPWEMYKGKKWANLRGVSYSYHHKYSVPCAWSSSVRNHARDWIVYADIPSIIGIGCTSPHYPLAYGYKYRKKKCLGVTVSIQRYFKCNMGWGGSSPSWENAKVWYATQDEAF